MVRVHTQFSGSCSEDFVAVIERERSPSPSLRLPMVMMLAMPQELLSAPTQMDLDGSAPSQVPHARPSAACFPPSVLPVRPPKATSALWLSPCLAPAVWACCTHPCRCLHFFGACFILNMLPPLPILVPRPVALPTLLTVSAFDCRCMSAWTSSVRFRDATQRPRGSFPSSTPTFISTGSARYESVRADSCLY